MSALEVEERPQYANYWESDTTMNPKIVQVGTRDGDFFDITLPNGEGHRQVHLHTLGRPHYAF